MSLNEKCIDVFYEIESDKYTDTEKIIAINHVLDTPRLCKAISKDVIVRAFKWFVNSTV